MSFYLHFIFLLTRRNNLQLPLRLWQVLFWLAILGLTSSMIWMIGGGLGGLGLSGFLFIIHSFSTFFVRIHACTYVDTTFLCIYGTDVAEASDTLYSTEEAF